MNKTFKITVDTQKSVQNPSFHVNTNDLRTIHLLMTVQSNGKPVNLEDAQVRIAVLKPDKKTVFQDVVVVDAASGLCEVILDSQAYVVPGEHTAELMIYFVGERVSVTGRFNYRAISGILNDKTVESQNEYQAINKLVLDAETAAQNAKQAENNAKQAEINAKQAETNAVNTVTELRTSVDDLSDQLALKLNKGEVSVSDIDKNKGKFDQTYMSDEFLQQIAGNSPINATPAKDSITTEMLTKNSVTTYNADFIEKSRNIFTLKNLTRLATVDNSGNVVANDYNHLTDYVRVKPNTVYTTKDITKTALYDESYNFIRNVSDSNFETDSNCVYARFIFLIPNGKTAQVNEGATLLPYDEPNNSIRQDLIRLGERVIKPKHTVFIENSVNLFNKRRVIPNKRISADNRQYGDLLDDVDHTTMIDFIDIIPNQEYSKSQHSMIAAYYDINEEFIETFSYSDSTVTFTTPKNARFMRITIRNEAIDNFMLNKGSVLMPYSEHKHIIKSTDEYPLEIDAALLPKIDPYTEDYYVVDPAFNNMYTARTMEDKSNDSNSPLDAMTLNEIYQLYDELMLKYPNYIFKEHLGDERTGLPIYKYEFKPEIPSKEPNSSVTPSKSIKIIITSGTHGVERNGVWTTYLAFRETCDNWMTDEVLEALRWNVHFVVIPVVNPWGFENKQRVNSNGVDINRNFPSGWIERDPSEQTYGGAEPLSELESQYVNNVLNENTDALYVIDFHNSFGDAYHEKNFVWINRTSMFDVTMGRYFIGKISRKWNKEQEFLAQHNYDSYGYVVVSPINGSIANHSTAIGIGGSTFEIQNAFPLEPNSKNHSSIVNTLGLESFINWLSTVIRNMVQIKNSKMYSEDTTR